MVDKKYFKDLNLFREAWINFLTMLTDIENRTFLENKFDSYFFNAEVTIYNSYTGASQTHLSSNLLEEIANKYIIVENGALFLRHEIFTAPCVVSYEILTKLRDTFKGIMKKYKAEGDNVSAGFYNLMQGNTKESLNTFYGIMINILSKYYNFDVAGSTTVRGRSTVTMNGLLIESTFGTFRHYNVSVHMHFINQCINKNIDWNFWGPILTENDVPTNDMLLNHLLQKHNDDFYYGKDLLIKRINKLTDKERYLVYYSSNFNAFLSLPYIQKLILKIMSIQNNRFHEVEDILNSNDVSKLKNLKKLIYIDPMSGPEDLKEHFLFIERYFREILFGFYWYEGDVNEYGERLDSTRDIFAIIERERIVLTDTDSLVIYLNEDMKKIYKIPGMEEATNKFSEDMLEYVLGSFIINALSTLVDTGLKRYTKMSLIPEAYRGNIMYKQEFFFNTLQVTKGAKNYIGLISIQEGVYLPNKQTELKGLSLKKSNFNPTLSKRAKEIALDMIAMRKTPDLREILNKIQEDRKELFDIYRNKDNIQMFTVSKYKKSYNQLYDYERGNDRIKACLLYNALFPDNEPIRIPGSFLVASIDLEDKEEILQDAYPEMYEKLYNYNKDRLVTKYKCALRAKIRALYDIDKKEDILLENLLNKELYDLMIEVDNINDYKELKEFVKEKNNYYKNLEGENVCKDILKMISFPNSPEKFKDINKIAIPLDSEFVDDFITQFLSTDDILVFENLASVIVEGLGLVVMRNADSRNALTNIVAYF